MDERQRNVDEAARAFFALLTASITNLDEERLVELAGDIAGEGGPYQQARILGIAVGATKELIHELAIATGRSEEEILQERAARWTR